MYTLNKQKLEALGDTVLTNKVLLNCLEEEECEQAKGQPTCRACGGAGWMTCDGIRVDCPCIGATPSPKQTRLEEVANEMNDEILKLRAKLDKKNKALDNCKCQNNE